MAGRVILRLPGARRILGEIQDGRYAADWIKENRDGRPWFEARRAEEREHSIEQVGKGLRRMMPFLDAVELPEPAALEPADAGPRC